jgi:hypothetical protein
VRDYDRHDHERHDGQAIRQQKESGEQHRCHRKGEHHGAHGADSHGYPWHQRQARKMRQRDATSGADEHRGKDRPAAEAAQ